MLSHRQTITLFASGLLAASLGSSIVRADTPCKGLEADQCTRQATCLWVKGYARKDGKAVRGYCRYKGSRTQGMTDKGASAGEPGPVGAGARPSDLNAS